MVDRRHSRAQALPLRVSTVHASPSSHELGQVPLGSHVSPGSMTPLPQTAGQSLSSSAVQPERQQPSPLVQVVMAVVEHTLVQLALLPLKVSRVQALPSLHEVGQLPSQVSPVSTTRLPQTGWQSRSLFALQPLGQHPSPPVHVVIAEKEQARVQLALLPIRVSRVQARPSLHEVGQLPGGSQVSPGSTTLLPHTASQSRSLTALQAEGQQPSLWLQTLMAVCVQVRVQRIDTPVMASLVHASPSLQLFGHEPGGSHVSPGSTTPLLQTGSQSSSPSALQPEGQQPSPLVHAVTRV